MLTNPKRAISPASLTWRSNISKRKRAQSLVAFVHKRCINFSNIEKLENACWGTGEMTLKKAAIYDVSSQGF